MKITLASFRETIRTGVPVTVGQISRVDVTMEVGALTETVTVQSEAQAAADRSALTCGPISQ